MNSVFPLRKNKLVNSRRVFIQSSVSLALASVLPVGVLCAAEAAVARRTPDPPSRARGTKVIDVRSMGARGDGTHDDTAAFQAAIDALPPAGGTVQVPAGTYRIDAVQSVRLRDHMHLDMAPSAKLVAIPNGERRAYVLQVTKVADVEISGGTIVGDRAGHLVATGEWGHGIRLGGASRVTIRDVRISDCWGDGICIGGADKQQKIPCEDIVISRVVCSANRRQGLSIGRSRNIRVYDSEFSDTAGTKPQYGIDIEPDSPGGADHIEIRNCLIRGNRGGGIQIFHRVTNVTITGCTIEENHGRGILAATGEQGLIADNVIRNNGLVGVTLRERTKDFQVLNNRFAGNGGRPDRSGRRRSKGLTPESAVQASPDTQGITITGNKYE